VRGLSPLHFKGRGNSALNGGSIHEEKERGPLEQWRKLQIAREGRILGEGKPCRRAESNKGNGRRGRNEDEDMMPLKWCLHA